MGVSQKGFNESQRRRLYKRYEKKQTLPENITTEEIRCQNCGFRARYKFYRCPECNAEQK